MNDKPYFPIFGMSHKPDQKHAAAERKNRRQPPQSAAEQPGYEIRRGVSGIAEAFLARVFHGAILSPVRFRPKTLRPARDMEDIALHNLFNPIEIAVADRDR